MSRPSIFLARRGYRQRRMMDAARVLPVVGAVLFLLPVFWRPEEGDAGGTAFGGLYLFAVWFALIVAAFLLSRRLAVVAGESAPRREIPPGDDEDDI